MNDWLNRALNPGEIPFLTVYRFLADLSTLRGETRMAKANRIASYMDELNAKRHVGLLYVAITHVHEYPDFEESIIDYLPERFI